MRALHLGPRLGERLAHLARDQVRRVLGARDQRLPPGVQHVGALPGRRARPGPALSVGGPDRLVDTVVGDVGDDLTGGGVRDRDALGQEPEPTDDGVRDPDRPRVAGDECGQGGGVHRFSSSPTACSIAATNDTSPSSGRDERRADLQRGAAQRT
nr:hypothetical protein [Pseudonocardia sp. N23]